MNAKKVHCKVMYENGYIPPILTVDMIIFSVIETQLSVLIIKRSQDPFKGTYAIPGGYNAAGETTLQAVARVTQAKAGIAVEDLKLVQQLHTFDTVARDPRGHAVSVTYIGLASDISPAANPTTQEPDFFPVSQLPALAYDHKDIISFAHKRLKADIMQTNAAYALLPHHFTLSQLQGVYEAVLGKPLDKRNFRKKFLSLNVIEATEEHHREGAHRPARLYSFRRQSLEYFVRSFD